MRNFSILIIEFLFICLFSKLVVVGLPKAQAAVNTQNYYAESLAESTITGTIAYQDKVTLTFTPDDNSTYVLIASWGMSTNNTGASVRTKMTRTTGTPTDFNEVIYFPKDVLNYISGGAIGIDTFGSSPGSQTYKIQFAVSNTARIARIKDARIIAIKLSSSDKYAEVDARTTTNSASYVDKTTLSFTPESTGDYIIFSSAVVDSNNTGASVKVQMNVDGTANTEMIKEPFNVANRYYWGTAKKVTLTNSAHDIKIQYSISNTARLGGIAYAKIVAIRADRFLNNYYAEEDTRTTAVNPLTYQTKTTLTATPLAQDHLIIGTAGVDLSSLTISVFSQLVKNTTPYSETRVEPKDLINRVHPYFVVAKETLSNTSTSWYTQYKSSANATAGIESSRILVLELREPSVNVGSSGTQVATINSNTANTYLGGAFTFSRDAGSATVSSITISNTGTIADTNLTGLTLYYKQEATCSSSIPVDATQFNSTPGTFSSGSSTVTGTMIVGTSQVCLYLKANVGNASAGDTIEIEITNPSTGVLVSVGSVTPATAVAISGTTSITTSGGSLSISIVDNLGALVASPYVNFSSGTFRWSIQQTLGTLGVTAQQLKISNFTSTPNWTLSLAATGGNTSLWQSGSDSYKFNGLDSEGRLQVNPSLATITPGGSCSSTGLTKQSSAYFVGGSVDSIDLIVAGSSAEINCDWFVTGVGLIQDIPAEQAGGSYSLAMTITVI